MCVEAGFLLLLKSLIGSHAAVGLPSSTVLVAAASLAASFFLLGIWPLSFCLTVLQDGLRGVLIPVFLQFRHHL